MSLLSEELNSVQEKIGQLAVSEIFGPTFQGEGSSIGRFCYFLRLAGCNQHCVWCDTPYTWDWTGRNGVKYDPRQEVRKFSVEDVIEELTSCGASLGKPSMLVVTGGEPMLQQKNLAPLLQILTLHGWRIEVETAGTIPPLEEFNLLVHQYNVSPKIENSGNELKLRYRPRVLNTLQETGRVCWKFVVTSREDLAEIKHIVKEHRLSPIFIMPEGKFEIDINNHMREVAQAVLDEGWNLTTRLQIEIWGNKRGV